MSYEAECLSSHVKRTGAALASEAICLNLISNEIIEKSLWRRFFERNKSWRIRGYQAINGIKNGIGETSSNLRWNSLRLLRINGSLTW